MEEGDRRTDSKGSGGRETDGRTVGKRRQTYEQWGKWGEGDRRTDSEGGGGRETDEDLTDRQAGGETES